MKQFIFAITLLIFSGCVSGKGIILKNDVEKQQKPGRLELKVLLKNPTSFSVYVDSLSFENLKADSLTILHFTEPLEVSSRDTILIKGPVILEQFIFPWKGKNSPLITQTAYIRMHGKIRHGESDFWKRKEPIFIPLRLEEGKTDLVVIEVGKDWYYLENNTAIPLFVQISFDPSVEPFTLSRQ